VSDNNAPRISPAAQGQPSGLDDHAARVLLDGVKDHGIFMLTPTGHVASWNRGADNITGYRADEIIGRHFSVFYPAELIARGWPEHELKTAAQEGGFEDSGWRLRKDGKRFWADVVVTPLHDEDGILHGYSTVVRDLTERKQHEERLKQSEERFRLLVECATDYAIFMLDENGFVRSWNSGAQAIKGYTAGEIIGSHFSRFYTPDAIERKWPEHELQEARKHGRFEDEGWRLRKDGSRFWANVIITAMRAPDGSFYGFSKITRDLTERLGHEQNLKHSEERFRLLVEGVTEYAIFMLDPDGRVMSWNAGAQRIKGYTADEIIGHSFTRFYAKEDLDAGKPFRTLQTARTRGSAHDRSWRVRKDGSRFLGEVSITALYDQSGKLYGFAKITRDLTREERIETLETEGRRLNEFLAMLAHELRNPLAPIRNAVDLMEMGGLGAAKLEWCRGVIDRQTRHMTRLVDDLLDVSRITQGKVALRKEPADLATLIERSLEAIRPLLEARRHSLKVTLPQQPLRLEADPTRLVQVIANLLNNAAKYTPEGGAIEIAASVDGAWAVIRVSDNGIGISKDLLDKVFDIFQQGDRELDRTEGGLGIGLTLVERIVAMHGGSVEARSEGPGRGSEFIVRLPVMSPEEEPAPAAGADGMGQLQPSGPLRILIVDDNVDATETMAMLIEAIGHQARMVHEGLSAAKAARDYGPDLVMLDIGLPGMDGYQVARQFRQSDDLRHLRLAAVTGYGQEQDRKRAKEAGFDEFLVKPISFDNLEALIGRVARGSKS
jgi:PAS domain S-box-containing protein